MYENHWNNNNNGWTPFSCVRFRDRHCHAVLFLWGNVMRPLLLSEHDDSKWQLCEGEKKDKTGSCLCLSFDSFSFYKVNVWFSLRLPLCSSSIGQRYPRRRSLWCFLLCLLFSISTAGLMVSAVPSRLSILEQCFKRKAVLLPLKRRLWSLPLLSLVQHGGCAVTSLCLPEKMHHRQNTTPASTPTEQQNRVTFSFPCFLLSLTLMCSTGRRRSPLHSFSVSSFAPR